MRILIDAGHGIDTPGKRSPDGSFLEYLWNREIAEMLYDLGYGVISEYDRLLEQSREELVGNVLNKGTSANNVVNQARETAKPIQ